LKFKNALFKIKITQWCLQIVGISRLGKGFPEIIHSFTIRYPVIAIGWKNYCSISLSTEISGDGNLAKCQNLYSAYLWITKAYSIASCKVFGGDLAKNINIRLQLMKRQKNDSLKQQQGLELISL